MRSPARPYYLQLAFVANDFSQVSQICVALDDAAECPVAAASDAAAVVLVAARRAGISVAGTSD